MLKAIHHAAIICSDYSRSKKFYTEILGLEIVAENYRAQRNFYKLDLRLPDGSQVEFFRFPTGRRGRDHGKGSQRHRVIGIFGGRY